MVVIGNTMIIFYLFIIMIGLVLRRMFSGNMLRRRKILKMS